MSRKLSNKIIAEISALLVVFLEFTVAQPIDGGSKIPATDISISEIINLMLFWDLGSGLGFWTGLVMFIVVWLGIHFATRPFLQQIFDVMLEHFPSSDSTRSINRNDEGEIKGINMLSLLAAFATAQIIGQFFGLIPLLILGILPVSMAAWGTYKGSSSFRNDFGEYLREARDATDGAEDDLDDGQDDIGDSEEDANAGNTGMADQEAERAAQEIHRALDEIEVAENDLLNVLDRAENQMVQILDELEQTMGIAEDQEELIEEIKQLENDLAGFLNEMLQREGFQIRDSQDRSLEGLYYELSRISQDVKRLADRIVEEEGEEEQEYQQLEAVISELLEVHRLLRELEGEVELAEREDEEIEQIAEALGDRDLYSEAETEEGKEKQLLERISVLQDKEQSLIRNLVQVRSILENLIQIQQEELGELESEGQMLGSVRTKAEDYQTRARISQSYSLFEDESGDQMNSEEVTENLVDILDQVAQDLQNIESALSQSENITEEMLSDVEEAMSELNR